MIVLPSPAPAPPNWQSVPASTTPAPPPVIVLPMITCVAAQVATVSAVSAPLIVLSNTCATPDSRRMPSPSPPSMSLCDTLTSAPARTVTVPPTVLRGAPGSPPSAPLELGLELDAVERAALDEHVGACAHDHRRIAAVDDHAVEDLAARRGGGEGDALAAGSSMWPGPSNVTGVVMENPAARVTVRPWTKFIASRPVPFAAAAASASPSVQSPSPHTPSAVVSSGSVTVNAPMSLSVIVTVALDGAPTVPPVGFESVTVNVSSFSAKLSFVIGTEMLFELSPAANDSVPEVAV